jgi:hypothetical protein
MLEGVAILTAKAAGTPMWQMAIRLGKPVEHDFPFSFRLTALPAKELFRFIKTL